MTTDEKLEVIKGHVAALSEHFDSVMVFCTKQNKGDEPTTSSWAWGEGNWFSRYGQVEEWLRKTQARTAKEVAQEEEQDDD